MKPSIQKPLLLILLCSTLQLVRAQDSRPILTFGMVTDVHYADIPDRGERTYSRSLEKLKGCVDSLNALGADFLIELGDFKDIGDPPVEEKGLIYLYRAKKVFSGFNGPRYHVLGNHDLDCLSKAQFSSKAKNSGISPEASYYSFDLKGIHVIVLDADYDSLGRDYDHGRFKWSDANIPAKELNWLKSDLRHARGTTLVFCHQLLDGEGSAYIRNSKEVRRLLEKSGKVAAVFQGHVHEGQYHLMNGIHYYTLKALVEGSSNEDNSFARVSVYPNRISVQGYGHATSMQFETGR